MAFFIDAAGRLAMTTTPKIPSPETLPFDGMSRWRQFARFAPISRECFRQLAKQGRAPQPIRLGVRCTMYSNRELHRWLADPLGYRAEGVKAHMRGNGSDPI